jgi:hypothetical protein
MIPGLIGSLKRRCGDVEYMSILLIEPHQAGSSYTCLVQAFRQVKVLRNRLVIIIIITCGRKRA